MGEKRKALVDQHGYDCKNASHCIRLLATAIDLVKTGDIKVYRSEDRDTLIDIKTGKWGLERVKEYADDLMVEFDSMANHCEFPPRVDPEKTDEILLNTMELAWK